MLVLLKLLFKLPKSISLSSTIPIDIDKFD